MWSMRTYVHVNLCLSLMAAQLLFVVAIDKTGSKVHRMHVLLDVCRDSGMCHCFQSHEYGLIASTDWLFRCGRSPPLPLSG